MLKLTEPIDSKEGLYTYSILFFYLYTFQRRFFQINRPITTPPTPATIITGIKYSAD